MNVTKEWVAQQATKASAPVREGWAGGALTVWVPGKPTHFKGKGHRYTVSNHTKDWRERTANRLYQVMSDADGSWTRRARFLSWTPEQPKRITFTVYTSGRGFDGPENLRLVCSPCLDALGMPRAYFRDGREVGGHGMGLIDDDKNPAHAISYEQVTKAEVVGIAIRVELA